jgi:hypothetical protein
MCRPFCVGERIELSSIPTKAMNRLTFTSDQGAKKRNFGFTTWLLPLTSVQHMKLRYCSLPAAESQRVIERLE